MNNFQFKQNTILRSIVTMFLIIFLSSVSLSLAIPENQGTIEVGQTMKPTNGAPKNLILMIGDGMSSEHIKLGRYVEVGPNGKLLIDDLLLGPEILTNNIEDLLTDSGAGGTALATGSKTYNGKISMCADGRNLTSITHIAKQLGMKTGIITTTTITHATPATFAVNDINRVSEDRIATKLIETEIDVLMGGGRSQFDSDLESKITSKGYTLVKTKSEMEASSGKTWGLFANSHLGYESVKSPSEPSILDMTKKAIQLLENPNGFLLVVEGGRIDHASHSNDVVNTALETINFDKAIGYAHQYAIQNPSTGLIVTSDHDTGGLTVVGENLITNAPTAGYSETQNITARVNRAREISTNWKTSYHSEINVPFYSYGLTGIPSDLEMENTKVFTLMKEFIDPLDSISASLSCAPIIQNPEQWTTGLHEGDISTVNMTKFFEGRDMTFTGRMAVNGTTEVISLDRNTDYDVEITKVNKTVIMYRWIMRFDDGSQITLDEQPIFRHAHSLVWTLAWPHYPSMAYDSIAGTNSLFTSMVTTNTTLLEAYYKYDENYELILNDDFILFKILNFASGSGEAFLQYNKTTGFLDKFWSTYSCCIHIIEEVGFESTYTPPVTTDSETITNPTDTNSVTITPSTSPTEETYVLSYSLFFTSLIVFTYFKRKIKNIKR